MTGSITTIRGDLITISGYAQITERDLLSSMLKISKNILNARLKAGLSQAELGAACGWKKPQTRISNYETDAREPSLGDLEKIAGALGLSLTGLIDYDNASSEVRAPQAVVQMEFYAATPDERNLLTGFKGLPVKGGSRMRVLAALADEIEQAVPVASKHDPTSKTQGSGV